MGSPNNGSEQVAASATSSSGRVEIDGLLADYHWGLGQGQPLSLSYSFPWTTQATAYWASNPSYSSTDEPGSAYALNETQRAAVRKALALWSQVANVTFTEISESATNVGDIRFAWTQRSLGPNTLGWAYEPNQYYASGGDVWLSATSALGSSGTQDWQPGKDGFHTLVHEIGHALGFKHPFEGAVQFPAVQDTAQYSVMSYTAHPRGLWVDFSQSNGRNYWESYQIYPETPMLDDVGAMQYLYGANMNWRGGDDVYTFDPATPFFRTLWDGGGNDTISVANFTQGCSIDLQAGHYSRVSIPPETSPVGVNWTVQPPTPTYDGTDNLAIAYGVIIENAVGGSGRDTLTGNDAANQLTGNAGDDTLIGGGGVDTARYGGQRAQFSVTPLGSTLTVRDNTGAEGVDALVDVERLRFADGSVAYDMGLQQAGGLTALVTGMAFGAASLQNRDLVANVLAFFDAHPSLAYACDYLVSSGMIDGLAGGSSNAALARLLTVNVMGRPVPEIVNVLQGWLDQGTMTRSQMLQMVAEHPFNQEHVNLVGLQQTGLLF